MNNFNFYNPTKIFFGENSITNLAEQIKDYKKILLAYGGGSIKKNGIYDAVIQILKKENKKIFELSDITPNPRLDKVREGINICKENSIDFILAVGGGSTIDCAKAVAIGAANLNIDVWDFYSKGIIPEVATSLGTILTMSATGTEMDSFSVLTNWETNDKLTCVADCIYPKFSILDPTYTYSLPKEQTVYGAIDILAHIFEQYFSYPNDKNLSDNISESIIKTVIENLDIALINPLDYNARANLMWCSTMALNGIIGLGKEQDWNSHDIEHALSGIYDIPHGAGLSIIFPSWMKYVYKNGKEKFKRYAINIWNVNEKNKTDDEIILEGIDMTKEYFSKVGSPVSLKEVGIYEKDLEKICNKININGNGSFVKIYSEDVKEILKGAIG